MSGETVKTRSGTDSREGNVGIRDGLESVERCPCFRHIYPGKTGQRSTEGRFQAGAEFRGPMEFWLIVERPSDYFHNLFGKIPFL